MNRAQIDPKDPTCAYIGDGVYVRHDGYHLWLMLTSGEAIALEPHCLARLDEYRKEVRARLARADEIDPDSTGEP